MGGVVAVALAEREPALVGGLILEGSPPEARFTELPLGARLFFAPLIGQALHRLVLASDGLVREGAATTLAEGAEVPDQFVADFRRATYPAFAGSRAGNVEFPKRLFGTGAPTRTLELVDSQTTAGGLVTLNYRRGSN
jgi:pimeloyl-ACP methyl ester carboxylesterase